MIHIDLTGPKGNAFALLGMARGWAKDLGLNWDDIRDDATSGDYEHLLSVLENAFGEYVSFDR